MILFGPEASVTETSVFHGATSEANKAIKYLGDEDFKFQTHPADSALSILW